MDEIRCGEKDYLIWKWRPKGGRRGRESSIRLGSSLRVREGSVAVFVYSDAHGQVVDYLVGPRDEILTTGNLPGLAGLIGLAYHGGTPYPAEVYFVNLAEVVQVRFGVPYFDVFDPRYPDFGVPVAVRGTLTFRIGDYQEFILKHRLDEFDLDDFKGQTRDAIVRYVRSVVTKIPGEQGIPLVQIGNRIDEVNDLLLPIVRQRLETDFAVRVSGLDVSAIELDKESEGYRLLMGVTRDQTMAVSRARTEAEVADIREQQRINSENLEATFRANREEDRYARRKATQTANLKAYELEVQGDVGTAGATALGRSGNDVGIGGAGNLVADMCVGGAIGEGMASMPGGTMGATFAQVPPPVPSPSAGPVYHVAMDGNATGPFGLGELGRMVATGRLTAETLVWRPGMVDWAMAGDVSDLAPLFARRGPRTPPPIPTA